MILPAVRSLSDLPYCIRASVLMGWYAVTTSGLFFMASGFPPSL